MPSNEITDFAWKGPTNGSTLQSFFDQLSEHDLFRPEAAFGIDTQTSVSVLERGLKAQSSVCRLAGPKNGTGFLVEEDVLLTNHHVVKSKERAREFEVIFNFQLSLSGIVARPQKYTLDPDSLFITSPQDELDFTMVRINGSPGLEWGFIPLREAHVEENMAAIVIHHPRGTYKKISLGDNEIVNVDRDNHRFHYLTDTHDGSSGAPVFDDHFTLVGLHHGAQLTPDRTRYFRNEAILIESILDHVGDVDRGRDSGTGNVVGEAADTDVEEANCNRRIAELEAELERLRRKKNKMDLADRTYRRFGPAPTLRTHS